MKYKINDQVYIKSLKITGVIVDCYNAGKHSTCLITGNISYTYDMDGFYTIHTKNGIVKDIEWEDIVKIDSLKFKKWIKG